MIKVVYSRLDYSSYKQIGGLKMSSNIDIIREVFEELFLKGNLANYDKLIDPNVHIHCPPSWKNIHLWEIQGKASIKEIDKEYAKAFKMIEVAIEDLIEKEDKVVVRWSAKGIHKEKFFDILPTNQKFELTGISIYRLNHQKIVEVWQSWDMLGLLRQIKK